MSSITILFADDQIPREDIPDGDIKRVLKEEHPDWQHGFLNAFPVMRKAVVTLKSAGYDVTTANTFADAMDIIDRRHFDIAIIDLGWFADEELPPADRGFAGWKLSSAIEKANRYSGMKATLQIIYSARFKDDPTISIQAADEGKLPIYKIYAESGHQALKAAVKFIESNLSAPTSVEQLAIDDARLIRKMMTDAWKKTQEQYIKWFRFTLFFIGLSVTILLIGVVYAIFFNLAIGVVSSIASIITSVISSVFLKQLGSLQEDMSKCTTDINEKYEHAMARLGMRV